MKTIKITSILLVFGIASMMVYANLRTISPTEKLKKVNLASFIMKGEISNAEKISLVQKVNKTEGVTACSLSKEGNLATVIFYPDFISRKKLASLLSDNGKIVVSEKELSREGGCPMPKISASVNYFVSALDLRN